MSPYTELTHFTPAYSSFIQKTYLRDFIKQEVFSIQYSPAQLLGLQFIVMPLTYLIQNVYTNYPNRHLQTCESHRRLLPEVANIQIWATGTVCNFIEGNLLY